MHKIQDVQPVQVYVHSEAESENDMARKPAAKNVMKQQKPTKPKVKPDGTKSKTYTVEEIQRQLKSMGDAKMRSIHVKNGAGDNIYGVKLGDIRVLANKIKTNHELALALWNTGNIDSQLLAILLMKPSLLSAEELEKLVCSVTFTYVADWLHSYVTKEHSEKETLRKKWMKSNDPMPARAGWRLTAGRVAKQPEGMDLVALLNRIESEMANAHPHIQWTMNSCLAEIGIHHSVHRKRALAIGEKLGIYRDYPCSKGCTSPFAPIWINEMVKRQGK